MNKIFRLLLVVGVFSIPASSAYAADQTDAIKLPKPVLTGKVSVETAMLKKKSDRNFNSSPLSLSQISQMLWAANGNLPMDSVTGATYKVFPSAGGLYPLEAFLVSGQNTVEGIPAGVYKYNASENSLSQVTSGDNRRLLAAASLGQTFMAQAPAMVVVAAVFERMTGKYGPRGMQYAFMEAGMANQNLFLQAEALGLKVASVGAFNDAQVAAVLKLPAGVTPLLVVPVGK